MKRRQKSVKAFHVRTFDRNDLTKTEKLIFTAILTCRDTSGSFPVCNPTQLEITKRSSVTSSTAIKDACDALEELGIIMVINRGGRNNYYFPDLY